MKGKIKKEIISFFIILSILTTLLFIWMFSGAKDNMLATLLMMWSPGIAAIITMLITKSRLKSLGWKLGKARFLIKSYTIPLLVAVIVYGFVWIFGIADYYTDEVVNYRWAKMIGFQLPVLPLIGILSKATFGFLFIMLFVVGEEIGWSGFLTPKLLQITSLPIASLIVGIFWGIWHAPAIIGGFYGTTLPLWLQLTSFTLVTIAVSFIRSILVSQSKSLWSGIILHTSHNVVLMGIGWDLTVKSGNAAYWVSESGLFTAMVYVLFALGYYYHFNKQKRLLINQK